MAAKTERTFIAIKPDGVQRGLVGEIIKRFEQKGFRLVALKFLQVCLRSSCGSPPLLQSLQSVGRSGIDWGNSKHSSTHTFTAVRQWRLGGGVDKPLTLIGQSD